MEEYLYGELKMLKIGKFARLGHVTIKALRYYDEIGLLKPAEIDKYTGYRYYSEDQLPRLNKIIVFKGLGLSLEEVSGLLDNNLSDENIIQLLNLKQAELSSRLRDYRIRLGLMEEWVKQIGKEEASPLNEVVVKPLEAQAVASLRQTVPTYADIYPLFVELVSYMVSRQVKMTPSPLAIFHDMGYREKEVDVEVAMPYEGRVDSSDRIKVKDLPRVEKAACITFKGTVETSEEAYKILIAWMMRNGCRLAAPNREVYIRGAAQVRDSREYITEVQFPITGL
ncbi:MAG: MerR family transcriptional regulator [Dehalococcoidia bacterium]|nr:MerR family transcriptional regulator [Dehalococcoidia bacterium]MDD5493403.1 MerR family transcriptional regulator [Dehalococcoidia bacterium]